MLAIRRLPGRFRRATRAARATSATRATAAAGAAVSAGLRRAEEELRAGRRPRHQVGGRGRNCCAPTPCRAGKAEEVAPAAARALQSKRLGEGASRVRQREILRELNARSGRDQRETLREARLLASLVAPSRAPDRRVSMSAAGTETDACPEPCEGPVDALVEREAEAGVEALQQLPAKVEVSRQPRTLGRERRDGVGRALEESAVVRQRHEPIGVSGPRDEPVVEHEELPARLEEAWPPLRTRHLLLLAAKASVRTVGREARRKWTARRPATHSDALSTESLLGLGRWRTRPAASRQNEVVGPQSCREIGERQGVSHSTSHRLSSTAL